MSLAYIISVSREPASIVSPSFVVFPSQHVAVYVSVFSCFVILSYLLQFDVMWVARNGMKGVEKFVKYADLIFLSHSLFVSFFTGYLSNGHL